MSVRVAVVQASTVLSDPTAAVADVRKWTAQAAGDGAELVVFPESFVGGYPKGSDFGAVVGRRSDEGRQAFLEFFRGAVEVPSGITNELGTIARDAGVHLVVGVLERDGATLYCAVLTFSPQGELLNRRRKLMGVAFERLLFGWGDAESLRVVDTPVGRIGTLMCWENLMPAARMTMYDQNVEIYCAPTAVGTEVDVATLRHIGREGRCFVLAANLVIGPGNFPNTYPPLHEGPPSAMLSRGGSCIVGPDGSILAGPIWEEEAILTADLDLDDITRWKYDFDVVGHFARPDLFTLVVHDNRAAAE